MMDIVERLRDAAALPTGLYAESADEITKLREQLAICQQTWLSPETYQALMDERSETLRKLAAVTRELDEAYKTVDDNWVSHQQLAATQAEVEALRKQLEESRANDRTAMGYLSKVRWVVGGNDFPDMVQRVETLRKVMQQALEALVDSVDLVREDYRTNWRHGIPTRAAQLAEQKAWLDRHEQAIAAIDAAMQPAADEAGKGGE